MDKLKVLITHRFWILFGLALLIPLIGWWWTSGELQARIDERTSELESAAQSAARGGDAPNETWTQALEEVNGRLQKQYEEAKKRLWEEQKRLMTWPVAIQKEMSALPYRGVLKSPTARYHYSRIYESEFISTVRTVEPFSRGKGMISVNWGGIHRAPFEKWSGLPPKWEEMWDAQEDIWLVRELLDAIVRVNRREDGEDILIAEAPIRQLMELQLRGGNRTRLGQQGGGRQGGGRQGAAGAGPPGGGFGRPGGGRGNGAGPGGGSMGAGGTSRRNVNFSLEKEFGPTSMLRGSQGRATARSAGQAPRGGRPQGARPDSGRRRQRRYVEDAGEFPYRLRAFKMSLIMRQERLPDLLAELNSSKWPVEIVRVHQQDMHMDAQGSVLTSAGGAGRQDFGAMPGEPGGNMGGGGAGPSGSFTGGAVGLPGDGQEVAAALADRYLVQVVIAGLMTLYNPPEEELAEAKRQQKALVDGNFDQVATAADVVGETADEAAAATDEVDAATDEVDAAAAGTRPVQPATDAAPPADSTVQPQPDRPADGETPKGVAEPTTPPEPEKTQ